MLAVDLATKLLRFCVWLSKVSLVSTASRAKQAVKDFSYLHCIHISEYFTYLNKAGSHCIRISEDLLY